MDNATILGKGMIMMKWFRKKNRPMHEQAKYFSLMLVPSYSAGKTRSIRITHRAFYVVSLTIVAVTAILLFLFFLSRFAYQRAMDYTASLEQAQMAYAQLQETTEEVQIRLLEGVTTLQYELTDEIARSQDELLHQQEVFFDTLESIWVHTEALEARLRQYEEYRQEIIEQLSGYSHLPIVSNILNEIHQSQMELVSVLYDLYGYSTASRHTELEQGSGIMLLAHSPDTTEDVTRNLFYYIAMLEYVRDAQEELFSDLERQVSSARRYIQRDRYGPDLLLWSHVRNILPRNTPVLVTDVRTGSTFHVMSFSHGNHADVFPATPEDTATLLRVFGGRWSWDTRPIWVHINGRRVAASINGMPHGGGGNRNNNMNGHICIHFRGSRTHSGSAFHERDHQNSVSEAYRAGLR